jgi:hypothetical protein
MLYRQGCGHDRQTVARNGGTAGEYAHGFQSPNTATKFRTIMAYPCYVSVCLVDGENEYNKVVCGILNLDS